MSTFAIEVVKNRIIDEGPGVIGDVEEQLASKYSFKSAQLHRMLSVSFYEAFRLVLEVKDDMKMNVEEETTGPAEWCPPGFIRGKRGNKKCWDPNGKRGDR